MPVCRRGVGWRRSPVRSWEWTVQIDTVAVRIAEGRVTLAPEGIPWLAHGPPTGLDQLGELGVDLGRGWELERQRESVPTDRARPPGNQVADQRLGVEHHVEP